MGFLRRDDPGGEQQLLGDGPADLVGQGPGAVDATVGGGQEAEARVLAPDAHVQGRGQDRGAAVRQAVHHPDRGLRAGADLVAAASTDGVASVELGLGVPAIILTLLVDVPAGGEGAVAGARDDDAADVVIGAHPRDRLAQLSAELGVHRVELLRAIHGDNRDPLRLLHEDGVRHSFPPESGSRATVRCSIHRWRRQRADPYRPRHALRPESRRGHRGLHAHRIPRLSRWGAHGRGDSQRDRVSPGGLSRAPDPAGRASGRPPR